MARPLDSLRDTRREWMINRSRLIAALLGISLLLTILVYRYYSLQIVQHDDFLTQSAAVKPGASKGVRNRLPSRRAGRQSVILAVSFAAYLGETA